MAGGATSVLTQAVWLQLLLLTICHPAPLRVKRIDEGVECPGQTAPLSRVQQAFLGGLRSSRELLQAGKAKSGRNQ